MKDYDGLINHFIDLLQKSFKKANRWENRYDTYFLLGKTAAYLDIVNTLIELKNERGCRDAKDSNG